jgi:hypothetical protein
MRLEVNPSEKLVFPRQPRDRTVPLREAARFTECLPRVSTQLDQQVVRGFRFDHSEINSVLLASAFVKGQTSAQNHLFLGNLKFGNSYLSLANLLFQVTTGHVTLLRPKRPADVPLCSSSQCR